MKISFLVTYYNQEQFVEDSLDSILAIDKPCEWEILVGDDGSTDGTVNIVNDYIKRYPDNVKLYVMPRDPSAKYNSVKRASENRINLLQNCTGDFFCTLDGDDFYCDTHFVNDAINVFESYPDISCVMFSFQYYQDEEFGEGKKLLAGADQRVDTRYYISNLYLHAGAGVHKIKWGKKELIIYRKSDSLTIMTL